MKSYAEINNEQGYYDNPDPFTLERYKQFSQHLPNQVKTLVDVGCNTGRGGKVLRDLNPDITLFALDCVQEHLDRITENIYSQKICSSTTDIALGDSSVDAVVAGEFIEHLYSYDVAQTIKEFYRIIKPGGRLLLTTPNPNYLLLKLTGRSVIGGAHVSQHYAKDLRKELRNIGFINVKILGSGKIYRLLGENFPLLMLYGSYLAIANKA